MWYVGKQLIFLSSFLHKYITMVFSRCPKYYGDIFRTYFTQITTLPFSKMSSAGTTGQYFILTSCILLQKIHVLVFQYQPTISGRDIKVEHVLRYRLLISTIEKDTCHIFMQSHSFENVNKIKTHTCDMQILFRNTQ